MRSRGGGGGWLLYWCDRSLCYDEDDEDEDEESVASLLICPSRVEYSGVAADEGEKG